MRQGKDVITYYKSDALNIANSVDSTRSKCDTKHRGSASFKHYHVKYKNIKWSIHSFYVYGIQDDFNSKYNDILKIATCYSENFSFFTVRQIHKKDHSNEYFNFLDGFRNHEIPLGKIKTPRYTAGQQIHCFRINKITTALLMKPIDFSSWNAYDYPEDLAFYKNCIPWFRCISHEKMVLVNETNFSAFNELKKIGINFRLINNSNYI